MPFRPPKHQLAKRSPRRTTHESWRPNANARGYGAKWEKARLDYLRAHPLCVHCLARGVITASTVVDHIEPHRGNKELFWDSANWQALCDPDHNRKTATEDGGFGNPRLSRP
jgi:5-methylcytosine-specific restriction protein A